MPTWQGDFTLVRDHQRQGARSDDAEWKIEALRYAEISDPLKSDAYCHIHLGRIDNGNLIAELSAIEARIASLADYPSDSSPWRAGVTTPRVIWGKSRHDMKHPELFIAGEIFGIRGILGPSYPHVALIGLVVWGVIHYAI
ncbi:hypothetical protein [Rhizobium leguminosarum]|uniref:hypothetical protein n=1 Tax=Rhizobium leguminosarum TaxID=384 RepID=UPI003F973BE8